MVLHKCKSSLDKNKTSARQPSLPDRELKIQQIHTSIVTQTSFLCLIWNWNIFPCLYFSTAVLKFAHVDNMDFPSICFENLCVWAFVDAFPIYKTPKKWLWIGQLKLGVADDGHSEVALLLNYVFF